MKILGLDEAGRGPVLGPLVVGAVMVQPNDSADLVAMGVDDSKRLSRSTRASLAAKIQQHFQSEVRCLEPLALEENLNSVELHCFADIINQFAPDRVIVDAPVNPGGIRGFVSQLLQRLRHRPEIVAENKADEKYPVVGAASIVAKVARDNAMLNLQQTYGDIGWGYPSEPKTVAFLQRCVLTGQWPPCVRQRWSTVQRLKQRALFEL